MAAAGVGASEPKGVTIGGHADHPFHATAVASVIAYAFLFTVSQKHSCAAGGGEKRPDTSGQCQKKEIIFLRPPKLNVTKEPLNFRCVGAAEDEARILCRFWPRPFIFLASILKRELTKEAQTISPIQKWELSDNVFIQNGFIFQLLKLQTGTSRLG